MKRFVDEIAVSDPDVVRNIVFALEKAPIDGKQYEVEMYDRSGDTDPMTAKRINSRFILKIFTKEGA